MNAEYGSELHMLRYLGRHRRKLNKLVAEEIGGSVSNIDWLDFEFGGSLDRELEGVEFLEDGSPAKAAWPEFWPCTWPNNVKRSVRQQNWDAVARVTIDGVPEWILVEAKAHEEEITSSGCGAKGDNRDKIHVALARTIKAVGSDKTADYWLGKDYQYANRLAALHFLRNLHEVPARLLFVYFCGDSQPEKKCPKHPEDWRGPIAEQKKRLGLADGYPLSEYVHELFLPVSGKVSFISGIALGRITPSAD